MAGAKWTKKAEKEYQREKRELAEEKEKARSESEDRQEQIKVLWGLAEQQLGIAKNRKLKEKQLKAQKLKQLLKSLEALTGNDDLVDPVKELIRLAALQDREIEYLTQFRRDWEEIDAHYPEQLENLRSANFHAGMRSLAEKHAEQKPKNFEDKRHGYKLSSGVGLIEYQFGGAGEAEWQRHSLSGPLGLPYQPTCLDKIFAGGRRQDA